MHAHSRFLEKIGRDFDTITICLSWKDVLLGKAELYRQHGFECVTAGHMFDPLFMSRLKSIIELATLTTSFELTSAFGYSVLMGKPHYYHEFDTTWRAESHDIIHRDTLGGKTAKPLFQWVLNLFSELRDDITPKQREAVYHYFGFYDTKTPEEVRAVFEITEDMYRQPEKYFFLTPAGKIAGQRRDWCSAFRKKRTQHIKEAYPQKMAGDTSTSKSFYRRLLNLGCGSRYHPAWVNVDFRSNGNGVIVHDLKKRLPFDDVSFDAVYHSHVLEHFPKHHAPLFLRECFRVLRPGGILRVVVPDLEQIVRLYLEALEKSLQGNHEAQYRYEWIMLELFDQMVRNVSGGDMLQYWRQNPMPAEAFVIARMGSEVKNVLHDLRSRQSSSSNPRPPEAPREPEAIGRFRLSGEVHQWMYDRYSLGKLLCEAGFEDVRVCRADESAIPDFNTYRLDIESDGSVRKPDSLFMEGRKPAAVTVREERTT